jgi:putative flippase GtrA
LLKRLVRFVIVGGINTLITLGIFYFLYNLMQINYLIASIVGYGIGIISSYIWNKLWTFESKSTAIGFEFSKFATLSLTGLVLNALMMAVFVKAFGIMPLVAQLITIALIFILNFLGSSYWVFKNPQSISKT